MQFESEIEELKGILSEYQSVLESNPKKSDLMGWMLQMSELNKEVALKTECTTIFAGNIEREMDEVEKQIHSEKVLNQNLKKLCKDIRTDIIEIDDIRRKTEKNHGERMAKIQKNYEEVG